jgi:hypothetical protein
MLLLRYMEGDLHGTSEEPEGVANKQLQIKLKFQRWVRSVIVQIHNGAIENVTPGNPILEFMNKGGGAEQSEPLPEDYLERLERLQVWWSNVP